MCQETFDRMNIYKDKEKAPKELVCSLALLST